MQELPVRILVVVAISRMRIFDCRREDYFACFRFLSGLVYVFSASYHLEDGQVVTRFP